MWYEFDQNNSGGNFHIDDKVGLGPVVWIEANTADQANERAKDLGIYFDGDGDCPCCGNRWYEAYDDGLNEIPELTKYSFSWHDKVFYHPMEGKFYTRMKPNED